MTLYIPIFDLACDRCDSGPVVGIQETPGSIRNTGLCGVHFFSSRLMVDWEEWNEPQESSE